VIAQSGTVILETASLNDRRLNGETKIPRRRREEKADA